VGWFSDAVSSIGDFITAPLGTTENAVSHVADVASNNPVLTAAAIAGAAYASGGASLAVTAPEAATLALDAASAGEATAAATSGFTLSQVAGAGMDAIKAAGTITSAIALSSPKPTAGRLNSGLGVYYLPAPSVAAPAAATKASGGDTGTDSARNVLPTQISKTLDFQTVIGYALGAFTLYEVFK